MNNRLLVGVSSVTCSLALLSTSCLTASYNKEKPNVLIVVLDDAGYNDFGFMGSEDIETPHIDQLAESGVKFTQGYVTSTVSGPSRAGLLTGRYQQRNGYECNLENILGLGLEEETIADVFKKNGYSTYCIGKWHMGASEPYHPNNRGFDQFYGFISGSRSYFYRPDADDLAGSEKALQYNGKYKSFSKYLTTELGDKAVDFIANQGDDPFLMYLSFNAVHTPMEATAEDLERFDGHGRPKLAAMTYSLDQAIGKVIHQLEKNKQLDNTLIFFLSDNGGAHNNSSSNYPLKGFKGNKFEGGCRVPFIVKYGNRFKGKYTGIMSSLDILPTAMSVAGISLESVKKPLDGVDLIPYLSGEKTGNSHNKLYWRKDGMAAMRMGDYKLIRAEGVGEKLYNLQDNLGETVDIQEEQPEIFSKMMHDLKNWEKGLINPPLWDEGKWTKVTREIHRDLMNNKPVKRYTP